MTPQSNNNSIPNTPVNKTLMRLERPFFELKKKDQSETEYVIRKLIDKRDEKPKIQAIQRSSIFSQLEMFMPKFKKADEQLKFTPTPLINKIDIKLEKVEDSSSSDQDKDQESESKQENSEMMDEEDEDKSIQASANQIELNFLKYDLPQKQQTDDKDLTQDYQIQQNNKLNNKKLIQQM